MEEDIAKNLFYDFDGKKAIVIGGAYSVDKATEEWLTEIEKKMKYSKWYFGHYHGNKTYVSAQMLYEEIRELGSDDFLQRLGYPKFRKGEAVCT